MASPTGTCKRHQIDPGCGRLTALRLPARRRCASDVSQDRQYGQDFDHFAFVDEPLVNGCFESIGDLDNVVGERCVAFTTNRWTYRVVAPLGGMAGGSASHDVDNQLYLDGLEKSRVKENP